MAVSSPFEELLAIVNDPSLRETGGGHNIKGIEFQRHWSVLRMFELSDEGAQDFLFLFEAIQDVAVMDSSTTPTAICIYQVKKKDRKEWSWSDLTALHEPDGKREKPLESIKDSPIGKLYASVKAIKVLKSTGGFISNAGCDLPLSDQTNMATSLKESLSALSAPHLDLLSRGLEKLHDDSEAVLDLSRLHIEKAILTPDDPGSVLVGKVHDFLLSRSPRHAGQARALVDALLAKVGPLAAKTTTCRTFDEIRKLCGYSKEEFDGALGNLEEIPDERAALESCLEALSREGMHIVQSQAIRTAAASYFRRKVMGGNTPEEEELIEDCDTWIKKHPLPSTLLPYLKEGVTFLRLKHPSSLKQPEIAVHLLLRALSLCADLTLEN